MKFMTAREKGDRRGGGDEGRVCVSKMNPFVKNGVHCA